MTPSGPRGFRLGVIGCGGISSRHGRAGLEADKVDLVACCDVREDAARAWAEEYDCEAHYTDFEEMIRVHQLDGVVLATWPNQHREQIERCLNAGVRNILCEKSLTETGPQAVEVTRLVEAAGAFLMEGFMYRHHPLMAELERLVAAGTIGRVDSVSAAFSTFDTQHESPDDPNRNWRRDPARAGGAPWDITCYAVNAANHVASIGAGGRGTAAGGPPGAAHAAGLMAARPRTAWCVGSRSGTYGVIDRQFGMIEYDSGCVGVVESSRRAHLSEALHVAGSEGRLLVRRAWRPAPAPVIEHQYGNGQVTEYPVPGVEMYQRQLENFVDAALGLAAPVMPLTQTVVNMFTIEALVTSVLEKRPVEIPLPDDLAARAA